MVENDNTNKNGNGAGHPFFGFVILAAVFFFVGAALHNFVLVLGPVAYRFPGGAHPLVIIFAIAILALIRGLDSLARGQVFDVLGRITRWFYPSLGSTLMELRKWYVANDSHNVEAPKVMSELMEAYRPVHGDTKELEGKHPFSQWMIAEVVSKYENNVQAFAYWGAAILILVIGLRGIQFLTKDDSSVIMMSLLLEFSLIGLLGFLIFFKPEPSSLPVEGNGRVDDATLQALKEDLKVLQNTGADFQGRFQDRLAKIEQEVASLTRKNKNSPSERS